MRLTHVADGLQIRRTAHTHSSLGLFDGIKLHGFRDFASSAAVSVLFPPYVAAVRAAALP
ncbi:MAG: hypothetical protein V7L09_33615 [Nostoc sp.]|uniref:hypothetical protein n=1 Tax=Nostoc sp. TaxID=1180 RepID=UPI002FF32CA0